MVIGNWQMVTGIANYHLPVTAYFNHGRLIGGGTAGTAYGPLRKAVK